MNRKNCVSGLFWMAFFLCFIYLSRQLDPEASYWPRMISMIGLVLSAASTVSSALKQKSETGKETVFPFTALQMKRSAAALILLILWVALIDILGFLVSSVVSMAVLFVGFEPVRTKKNVLRDILVAVMFGAGMYGLFTALGISFPAGFLI